jgi:exonuclease III
LRILTWNIRHGGGSRTGQIFDAIAHHCADIIVLTEFRASFGGLALAARLRAGGYEFQFTASSRPAQNSVFIAAGSAARPNGSNGLAPDLSHRCLSITSNGIRLLGLYFPMGHKKLPLYEYLLKLPVSVTREQAILIGDFNTGRHLLDEAGSAFIGSEYFDRLESLGWIDAWRHFHPDGKEYSWFSAKGNGFRVDHIFCTQALLGSVRSVEYSHAEREARISDHSVLVVNLDVNEGS